MKTSPTETPRLCYEIVFTGTLSSREERPVCTLFGRSMLPGQWASPSNTYAASISRNDWLGLNPPRSPKVTSWDLPMVVTQPLYDLLSPVLQSTALVFADERKVIRVTDVSDRDENEMERTYFLGDWESEHVIPCGLWHEERLAAISSGVQGIVGFDKTGKVLTSLALSITGFLALYPVPAEASRDRRKTTRLFVPLRSRKRSGTVAGGIHP